MDDISSKQGSEQQRAWMEIQAGQGFSEEQWTRVNAVKLPKLVIQRFSGVGKGKCFGVNVKWPYIVMKV